MTAKKPVLLVDVGNTRIKWRQLPNGVIEGVSHLECDIQKLLDGHWRLMDPPGRILIANVAGDRIGLGITGWIRESWNMEPEFVQSQETAFGVVNAYRTPGQLGVDRWLTLLALHRECAQDVCIVDAGTAITIDVLNRDGRHMGGLILPGLGLAREALLGRTGIPHLPPARVVRLLADNTAEAVASASLHAGAGLIERVIVNWRLEHQRKIELVLTGSDAQLLNEVLSVKSEVRDDLVMQGLALMANAGADSR